MTEPAAPPPRCFPVDAAVEVHLVRFTVLREPPKDPGRPPKLIRRWRPARVVRSDPLTVAFADGQRFVVGDHVPVRRLGE